MFLLWVICWDSLLGRSITATGLVFGKFLFWCVESEHLGELIFDRQSLHCPWIRLCCTRDPSAITSNVAFFPKLQVSGPQRRRHKPGGYFLLPLCTACNHFAETMEGVLNKPLIIASVWLRRRSAPSLCAASKMLITATIQSFESILQRTHPARSMSINYITVVILHRWLFPPAKLE